MLYKILKYIRVIVAMIMLVAITFYLLDFSGLAPQWIGDLLNLQSVPSILKNINITLIVLIVLTLLIGRIYCSILCPLGIFQDVISRIAKWRKKKKKRYAYTSPKNILRFGILAATGVTAIFGLNLLLILLDPYSIYGRIAVNIFRPVYIGGNNLIANIESNFDSYNFYHVGIDTFSVFAFSLSILMLLLIIYMAYKHGRLYCDTICPVGAFLGLLSKVSLFKMMINTKKCIKCRKCEISCKSSCIKSKTYEVDFSRCVDCFNCTTNCGYNAIGLRFSPSPRMSQKKETKVEIANDSYAINSPDMAKRRFIGTTVGTFVGIGLPAQEKVISGISTVSYKKRNPVSPPGSISFEHFKSKCTACHACVSRCPSQVLKPSFLQYGLDGLMMPRMDYFASFCNFECTICTEVCPTGALQPLTVEQKKVLQIGKVVFVKENCVVYTQDMDCGACSEHCPTKAVDMVPYKGTLTIPKINTDICIGCGGCEFICPARPMRAIYIEGNPIHLTAEKPEEAEKKEVELEEFPF
ncbi:MAG: 4Fe-4S binding protein [Prevotellaceae bacterium]|jgi:ferredoxin|nr:4Fe-4S binding protein [Prevotellaceae bacterium]